MAPSGYKWLPIALNCSKWLQLSLNGTKWLQLSLNGTKWCCIFHNHLCPPPPLPPGIEGVSQKMLTNLQLCPNAVLFTAFNKKCIWKFRCLIANKCCLFFKRDMKHYTWTEKTNNHGHKFTTSHCSVLAVRFYDFWFLVVDKPPLAFVSVATAISVPLCLTSPSVKPSVRRDGVAAISAPHLVQGGQTRSRSGCLVRWLSADWHEWGGGVGGESDGLTAGVRGSSSLPCPGAGVNAQDAAQWQVKKTITSPQHSFETFTISALEIIAIAFWRIKILLQMAPNGSK